MDSKVKPLQVTRLAGQLCLVSLSTELRGSCRGQISKKTATSGTNSLQFPWPGGWGMCCGLGWAGEKQILQEQGESGYKPGVSVGWPLVQPLPPCALGVVFAMFLPQGNPHPRNPNRKAYAVKLSWYCSTPGLA